MITAGRFTLARTVSTSSKKKTTQLKQLLSSPQLAFLMEAHSGLSARIVQEAGTHITHSTQIADLTCMIV
jgi:2-methylisocitrate lyase-like PEP mutase family enzyme